MKRIFRFAVVMCVLAVPIGAAASKYASEPELPIELRPIPSEDDVTDADVERELVRFEAWARDVLRDRARKEKQRAAKRPRLNVRVAPVHKTVDHSHARDGAGAPLPDPDEVLSRDVVGNATTHAAWHLPAEWK